METFSQPQSGPMESLKWIIQRRADQVAAKAHGSLNRAFGQVSSSKALSDGHADPNEDDRKLFSLADATRRGTFYPTQKDV